MQCSQQVFAALAILAEVPDLKELGCPWSADRLRELALAMFRYSVRTHLTGDIPASDGQKWGRHWISVLGLERAVPGLNALYPYMTDDDRARLRALDLFEAPGVGLVGRLAVLLELLDGPEAFCAAYPEEIPVPPIM